MGAARLEGVAMVLACEEDCGPAWRKRKQLVAGISGGGRGAGEVPDAWRPRGRTDLPDLLAVPPAIPRVISAPLDAIGCFE